MDAELRTATAPFRDPRFAPGGLEIEERPGGEIVLRNPRPFSLAFQTMTAALTHWAAAAPDRVWLAERAGEGWRRETFAACDQMVRALAGGLRGLGVVGRGPLLILSHNRLDHVLVKYAAMSQGMPVSPVSVQYGLKGANLTRLAHAAQVLRPAAVYTEDAALFAEGLSCDALAGLPVIAAANPRPGDISLATLLRAAPADPCAAPEDHAKYMLTSGSTGLPKAVITTHRGIALNSAQITACFDDPEPPVWVSNAPWSHTMGANSVLHQSLHRGATLHIDAGLPVAGRFGETLRNLTEVAPTQLNMVPAGWLLLVDALEADEALARNFFSRIRLLQYGGATMGQATADRIEAAAVRTVGERISFSTAFGSTETGPTATSVHWINDRVGLCGLPVPGTSVRLVPENGKVECRIRGPQISPGYLGRPDLTEAAFDEEGFFRLGDAVRFADPAEPRRGLVFDGRMAENFKLASGTFVSAGTLRAAAVAAVGGAVTDAVVCGEGEGEVGLLFYPNPDMGRAEVEAAVKAGMARFRAAGGGSSMRIGRALVLPDPPDAVSGEITDKGYIAQSLARSRRAEAIARLFAEPAAPDVMVFP